MIDQTTAPLAPDPDPTWRRLVLDADAFQRAYPTPAHLAELVRQLAVEAFAQGAAYGRPERAGWRPSGDAVRHVVAGIMNDVARRPDDPAVAALHAFAHASQRARAAGERATPAAVVAAVETKPNGGVCDG